MKNRIFIPAVLTVLLFSGLAWGQDAAAPEIFFKEKTFVADEVLEGTPVEHTYTVYNRGNAVLRIFNVRPG